MTQTARSVMFLCGLLLVLGGLTSIGSDDAAGLGLASTGIGVLLIARSGLVRPLPLAAAIVLLGLAVQVLVVATPGPVDWLMVGVATVAMVAAVAVLRSRGRRAGAPPVGRL